MYVYEGRDGGQHDWKREQGSWESGRTIKEWAELPNVLTISQDKANQRDNIGRFALEKPQKSKSAARLWPAENSTARICPWQTRK